MLLKEFKQIANEFGLSYYHDSDCKDYSITLDGRDLHSDNHIATWKRDHVTVYAMPIIEESVVPWPVICCGNAIIREEYNQAAVLRKYVSDAVAKYRELKKEIRFRKITEL